MKHFWTIPIGIFVVFFILVSTISLPTILVAEAISDRNRTLSKIKPTKFYNCECEVVVKEYGE